MGRQYLMGMVSLCALAACAGDEAGQSAPIPPTIPPMAPETVAQWRGGVPAAPAPSATALAARIAQGDLTAEAVVRDYLARIEALDPTLQSVLSLNPNALAQARALDEEAAAGTLRGALHGVPVLVKDNIETADLPTTAGSMALAANETGRDAPIIARLRREGAIILGKTNLSEWANFRSEGSISGWSGLGGQTRNPHSLDRSPCGSSSGSGAAIAAQLAPLAIGTETNGSIMCPAAMNGIVGFKPTVGLLEQDLIVPISSTQDTAGPMTRYVEDAALMMNVMSSDAGADYISGLEDGLSGMRIGVLRWAEGDIPEVSAAFAEATTALAAQGAVLVEITEFDVPDGFWDSAYLVLKTEFKATLNDYLAQAAPGVTVRSLADLVGYNQTHADREMALFNQDILEMSEATKGLDDPDYAAARTMILSATRQNGIDKMLADASVEVVVMPSRPPAFLIDAVFGDSYPGGSVGAGWLAAIAGSPIATVPMGAMRGLPLGLSITGAHGDDAKVLRVAYQYEQASQKLLTPTFAEDAFAHAATAKAMRPLDAKEDQ